MKNNFPSIKWLLLLPVIISCGADDKKNNTVTDNKAPAIFQLAEMNTAQLKALDKANTVVLLTGGILEEHGPYLPSFTDGYWNERFADTLAKIIAFEKDMNVLLFPVIPLGNSGANDVGLKYSFPGTYTIRFETLRSVFMDLAVELGEQGFKNIFIIHGHGAPNHQRALDQAADFFNDTYKGKMINLMGLNPVLSNWFAAEKTKEQDAEDGFSIHAGMAETSSMLFLVPRLVDTGYKNAVPFTGKDMESLVEIGKKADWPGYFGSQRIASASFGEKAWKDNVADFSKLALDILDGKVSADTIQRFGDFMKQSKTDVMLDSLSLNEEARRKSLQQNWLIKKGFN